MLQAASSDEAIRFAKDNIEMTPRLFDGFDLARFRTAVVSVDSLLPELPPIDRNEREFCAPDGDDLIRWATDLTGGHGALVVESDVQRRGGSPLSGPHGWIDDRLIEWAPVSDAEACFDLVFAWSRYFVNGLVCRDAQRVSELVGQGDLRSALEPLHAECCGFFSAIWDNESFVLLS